MVRLGCFVHNALMIWMCCSKLSIGRVMAKLVKLRSSKKPHGAPKRSPPTCSRKELLTFPSRSWREIKAASRNGLCIVHRLKRSGPTFPRRIRRILPWVTPRGCPLAALSVMLQMEIVYGMPLLKKPALQKRSDPIDRWELGLSALWNKMPSSRLYGLISSVLTPGENLPSWRGRTICPSRTQCRLGAAPLKLLFVVKD